MEAKIEQLRSLGYNVVQFNQEPAIKLDKPVPWWAAYVSFSVTDTIEEIQKAINSIEYKFANAIKPEWGPEYSKDDIS